MVPGGEVALSILVFQHVGTVCKAETGESVLVGRNLAEILGACDLCRTLPFVIIERNVVLLVQALQDQVAFFVLGDGYVHGLGLQGRIIIGLVVSQGIIADELILGQVVERVSPGDFLVVQDDDVVGLGIEGEFLERLFPDLHGLIQAATVRKDGEGDLDPLIIVIDDSVFARERDTEVAGRRCASVRLIQVAFHFFPGRRDTIRDALQGSFLAQDALQI